MLGQASNWTFGVELECLFGFHESLLQSHLDAQVEESKIVKRVPEHVRREFRLGNSMYRQTRPQYIGWALTSPSAFPTHRDDAAQGHGWLESCRREFGYRPYGEEILQLAKGVLGESVDVHADSRNKRIDFSKWHLAVDTSLVGATEDELREKLGGRVGGGEVEKWDSSGVELVSRPLAPTEESFKEISGFLELLKGQAGSPYGAFVSRYCGMHVHVALPPGPNDSGNEPAGMFDLPTLQHLAYILVMYEAEINKMHPPSTRGTYSVAAMTDCKTNLDVFYADSEAAFMEREATAAMVAEEAGKEEARANEGETHPSTPEISDLATLTLSPSLTPTSSTTSLSSACSAPSTTASDEEEEEEEPTHETIWDPFAKEYVQVEIDGPSHLSFRRARTRVFSPEMTLEKLVDSMSNGGVRERTVNWTYLLRPHGARTIEFRQHEGTLEAEGVKWWVLFCMGLVKVAHAMAGKYGVGSGYQGHGYPHRWLSEKMGVVELMGMMGMEEEGLGYWKRKMEVFAKEREEDF